MKEIGDFVAVLRNSIIPENILNNTYYVGLEHINGISGEMNGVNVQAGEIASNKFKFKQGHILYGKLRPYLRKISLAKRDGICSTDIIPIEVGENADVRYVYWSQFLGLKPRTFSTENSLFYLYKKKQYVNLSSGFSYSYTFNSSSSLGDKISLSSLAEFCKRTLS